MRFKPCTRPAKPYRMILSAALAAALSSTARAAAPTAAAIDDSIQRGKAFLYSIQNVDGAWESEATPPTTKPKDAKGTSDEVQWGGRTALAVYTLLELGESPTEAKLQKAIKFLQTSPISSTYPLSLKCMVWSNLPQTAEVKKALRRDATQLLSYRKISVQNCVVWDYAAPDKDRPKNYSLLSTEQAAFGLAAAADADFEVPIDVWKGIERAFTLGQTDTGGWRDRFEKDVGKAALAKPLTMYGTAGGAAALQIAQDFTRADATPRGNVASPALDKAADWIKKNLDQPPSGEGAENANRRLYGIVQFALATGLRRLGDKDWYAAASEWLVANQKKKVDSWGATARSNGVDYRLIDTCWALLALQRGRVPVGIAKLDYSPASEDPKKALWNQRPRDAANLARWIGHATERELRWQIVTTNDTIDALLESPVLYVAGGESLQLKPDAKAKLKAYVESGGLIFAAADGGSAAFSKSVERLATELFPGNEWRDVPDTHPLLATQMFRRASFKARPQIRAIGNGVREFVILLPVGDLARTWQLRSGRVNPDAWQLAADVLSYAVDKSHYYARGESWLAAATTKTAKRTITVGRLKYAGPWDPEPMAWTQFGRYARARDLGVKTVAVDAGKSIKDVDALYVTGSAAFTLDDAGRAAIKTYLDGGGRVIFEAAGGNPAFAGSAQAELTRWYGADAVVPLPPTHALYGGKPAVAFRGYNIGSIEKPTEPQLRAVEVGGRVVALLSREDLTAGLLGVPTDGITGYVPNSARSLLLCVLNRWK